MSEPREPCDWLGEKARLDAAIAEAMRSAKTWFEGCIAGAMSLGASQAEAVDDGDWSSRAWHDTTLFRFLTVHIAGSSWGLYVRELAGTAFLLTDWDEPHEEHVWGWWAPPDDRVALESAVEEAWLRHRWDMSLPPAASTIGVIWEGPEEEYALAFRCMDRLLLENDEAWSEFKEQLPDAVDSLDRVQADGLRMEEMAGNAPEPVHAFAWLKAIVGSADLDACRMDPAARRSLVSYYLKA